MSCSSQNQQETLPSARSISLVAHHVPSLSGLQVNHRNWPGVPHGQQMGRCLCIVLSHFNHIQAQALVLNRVHRLSPVGFVVIPLPSQARLVNCLWKGSVSRWPAPPHSRGCLRSGSDKSSVRLPIRCSTDPLACQTGNADRSPASTVSVSVSPSFILSGWPQSTT